MLDALTRNINLRVEQLLRAACGEQPGWPEMLRGCGLQPAPAASGPAPVAEVRQVVTALALEASNALNALLVDHPALDPHRVAAIRLRLGLLVEFEVGRYARALAAAESPPPSGIAAIFQNAVETAKLSPWANLEYDRNVTVICPTCGGPQQTQRVFRCEFCDQEIFPEEK